jgi:Flp pilus assembly protein CpaB
MTIPAIRKLGACGMLLLAASIFGRSVKAQVSYPAASVTVTAPHSPEEAKAVAAAEQANRIELHKRAIADTAQMQVLTAELKDELSKFSAGTLSADAIKKAREIEKLAHKIAKEVQP